MSASTATSPLEQARATYQQSRAAHGGAPDPAAAQAFIDALEKELVKARSDLTRLTQKLDRSGTVYHAPHV